MNRIVLFLPILIVSLIFSADSAKETLYIKGMNCNDCVTKVTSALQKVKGVENVSVNLETGAAVITHSGSNLADLKDAVVKAGFTPVDQKEKSASKSSCCGEEGSEGGSGDDCSDHKTEKES